MPKKYIYKYHDMKLSSLQLLCEKAGANYENVRFRAKKLCIKPSALTKEQLEKIIDTPSHPGRQSDLGYLIHQNLGAEASP
jgi:hypothetical protein